MKRYDVAERGSDELVVESANGDYVAYEDAQTEIARLRGLMKGWSSYAWKDGQYIDDVQEFFDEHMGDNNES